MDVLEATTRALGVLRRGGVRAALVGGLAVSVRSEPRFTRDVDLAVAVGSDAEAERLVLAFQSDGWAVSSQLEHETSGRLAAVRLAPQAGEETEPVLDLLFASSGIEPELVRAAVPLEIVPGLLVPVATTGYLLALKTLAADDVRRPQDRVDLVALMRVATPTDLAEARAACELITARGYHRGRDLSGLLESLLRSVRGG